MTRIVFVQPTATKPRIGRPRKYNWTTDAEKREFYNKQKREHRLKLKAERQRLLKLEKAIRLAGLEFLDQPT